MSTVVAIGRTAVTMSFLLTLGSPVSLALSLEDVSPAVKSCKAIASDRDRLTCFDRLFGETSKLPTSQEGAQTNWSVEETKSPDGSDQVIATNLVGDVVLILRCKDQNTEAAFSTQYNYLGYKSVDVQLRINDRSPIKEVWKASVNGRAAFAPDAVAFIRSLPDNGKLSIKTTRSTDGKVKEGKFELGGVSEIRTKIAKACDWADGSADEPTGSIDQQEKR
jgi:hypothetical protein